MTKAEVIKIMTYIFAESDVSVSEDRIQVWEDHLRDVDFKLGQLAAKVLAGRKTFGAPKISDFLEALQEVTATKEDRETWGEAWDIFTTIAHRYGYYNREKILPEVRKQSPLAADVMVGGVEEYLKSEESDVPVIRAQFRSRYEALQTRAKQARGYPREVQELLRGQRTPGEFTKVGDILPNVIRAVEGSYDAKKK